MHLVGFIIRLYHAARQAERQSLIRVSNYTVIFSKKLNNVCM